MKTGILALSIFLVCFQSVTANAGLLPPGSAAPTFSLPALNGDRVSLRVYCGDTLLKPHINSVRQIVVLNFWATYCKPCQKEIPELMRFSEKHKDDSVKVFCISIDKEGASLVSPFIKEKGYTVPVLLDPYMKTAQRYGVEALPALFVIDPYGKIAFSAVGYDSLEQLDIKLERIVSEVRQGKKVEAGYSGETVEIEGESSPGKSKAITPKTRWDAIVKVECGVPLDSVASGLGVSAEQVRSWYEELKKAAISLWSDLPE